MESALQQKQLMLQYQQAFLQGLPAPNWPDMGWRGNSQNDEDGYLLFIYALLGFKTRRVVEICCGNGVESITANLILHHNCTGLLFEGDAKTAGAAQQFYANHPNTRVWPPTLVNQWVNRDNINQLIAEHGISGEVDLLAIDIDGNDYWLWQALTVIQPRVVVTEYNHLWGPDAAMSIPYDPNFVAESDGYGTGYAGATLAAMIKLAASKNYRYIGSNNIGINAFFVRNDCVHPWLPAVPAANAYWHPRTEFGRRVRWPKIKDKPWVEV